jgi:hypothetical protein
MCNISNDIISNFSYSIKVNKRPCSVNIVRYMIENHKFRRDYILESFPTSNSLFDMLSFASYIYFKNEDDAITFKLKYDI